MKHVTAIVLAATVFTSANGFAQTGSQHDFGTAYDAFISKTLEKIPDIPAVAVVVIRDGKPIFLKTYGLADKEAGLQADTNTLFYIASSTKAFTALAAALLDKQGSIKFADPVATYLSGLRFRNEIPERITVRDLLTHTSGLRNDALANRFAATGQVEPREIEYVFTEATAFSENNHGTFQYSNLGYNVYGILVEKHLNTKWQDLLQETIFDPLGMKHTTAYVSKVAAKKWNMATPYVFDSQAGKTVRSVLGKKDNTMQSAGGIFASISDIGRWLNMNMNGGELAGKQVMPADLIRAAHTGLARTTRNDPPFAGDGEYGLGWNIGAYRNEKVVYHHGAYPGYSNHFSFLPDRKIAVAVVTNHDPIGVRAGHLLATYAYDWFLGIDNLEISYARQLDEIVTAYEARKRQLVAAAAERANRTWQLTKPLGDYTGKYRNDLWGTIEIAANEKSIVVRLGELNCVATPFTDPDTIRVEMIPGGGGQVMEFVKGVDGTFQSLKFGGLSFERIAL